MKQRKLDKYIPSALEEEKIRQRTMEEYLRGMHLPCIKGFEISHALLAKTLHEAILSQIELVSYSKLNTTSRIESTDSILKIIESQQERFEMIYHIFTEQITALLAIKTLTMKVKIERCIDQIIAIASYASVTVINKSIEKTYNAIRTDYELKSLCEGLVFVFFHSLLTHLKHATETFTENDAKIMIVTGVKNEAVGLPYGSLPEKYLHLLAVQASFKERASYSYENFCNDVKMTVVGNTLQIELVTKSHEFLEHYSHMLLHQFILITHQTTQVLRSFVESLVQASISDEPHSADMSLEVYKELSDKRSALIKERFRPEYWHKVPEFSFAMGGKKQEKLYGEALKLWGPTEEGGLFMQYSFSVHFVPELLTQKHEVMLENHEMDALIVQGSRANIPGTLGCINICLLTGIVSFGGTLWNSASFSPSSPVPLGEEFSLFPHGVALANYLEEKICAELYKWFDTLEKEVQDEIEKEIYDSLEALPEMTTAQEEVEEIIWEDSDEEIFAHQIPEKKETIEDLRRTIDKDALVILRNKSYCIKKLPEGQLPDYKIRALLETVEKEYRLPEGYTLKELPRSVEAIGWRTISQIVKKDFHCSIFKKGTTHFTIKRMVNGQEKTSKILAPERNKYAKDAAYGTLTSMLRALHIDEELFWQVNAKNTSPEEVINMNKEEYYNKLNAISKKLT